MNDNLPPKPTAGSELADALRRSRSAFLGVGLLSGLINILMLTGPLFMLQIYDRVLPSHSIPTLVGLAILCAGSVLCFREFWMRSAVVFSCASGGRSMARCRHAPTTPLRVFRLRARRDGLQPIRDLDQIRSFLSSAGPSALFDLPWMPLYVGICFLFHPLIGIAAACGAVILIVLTVMAEAVTRKSTKAAVGFAAARDALPRSEQAQCRSVAGHGHGRSHAGALRGSE